MLPEAVAADSAGALDGRPQAAVGDCLAKGIANLKALQRSDGRFEGEVVWCPMILAQYVILRSFLRRPIPEPERAGMVRHFAHTRQPDGGWGLHAEAPSYVFVTTLAYVALRLLGLSADTPLTAGARRWLHAQPTGVLGIPSWGKFWLAMAGLYDYAGMNPCPPELFLLPTRSPVHPNHLYCHTRYIYLAISFLYGARFRGDLGPITEALRRELYSEPYDTIDFAAHRNDIARTDLYVAPSGALRAAWRRDGGVRALGPEAPVFARVAAARARALPAAASASSRRQATSRLCRRSMASSTRSRCSLTIRRIPMLGPSLAGVESWRWDDTEDGIRFAGARSTSWDTAFAMLAVLAGPGEERSLVRRAYDFLDAAQEQGELDGGAREARDPIRGGWCFSDGRHRWPVSDCTAEALSALLAANSAAMADSRRQVSPERLEAAVHFILDRQNADGGFGTYERRRGLAFLERLNPSEMFGDCMTELSYIECTASAVIALCRFREQHPDRHDAAIDRAMAAGCAVLRQRQRADGSWPGFWGINFTYATWFAVSALRSCGHGTPGSGAWTRGAVAGRQAEARRRLGRALLRLSQRQLRRASGESGGDDELGAARAARHRRTRGRKPVQRGIAWLCRAQGADGSWPQGAVNGVFFGSAMLVVPAVSGLLPRLGSQPLSRAHLRWPT